VKLQRIFDKDEPVGWVHWCPGCKAPHGIYVEKAHPKTKAKWTFDGNQEQPTFHPSIHCYTTNGHWSDKPPHEWVEGPKRTTTCHYFIKKGVLEYCADSPHELSGKKVPLPDYPEAPK